MLIAGHQANLSISIQEGKEWELYVDPDYSWYENAGEFVIEEVGKDYVVLRDQKDWGRKKVLNLADIVVVEYSQDRRRT